ncbi:MAG TPA: tetratricopeptide repeat protein, partial [Rhizomicrobium sp.]
AFRPAPLALHGNGHVPNAEAERLYRAGLYAWQTRTPVGLTHAVDDFTQAIVHDPQYAQAYAGLASCYNLLREYTAMPASYAFPRAKAAAERAIALDPSLADAHASLAFIDFYWTHDAATAEREYKRAIALSPNGATAHHWYANFLTNFGRFREALAEIDTAQQIDTSSTSILADKGMILFVAGRTDEAITLLRQLEETEPRFSSPHFYLAMISRARGDDAGFVRESLTDAAIRQDPTFHAIAAAASRGLAQGGHKGMLLALLAAQQQRFGQQDDSAYQLAMTYAQLGDTKQALRYLQLSFRRHETDVVSLNIEPLFRPLRTLPQFRKLVRQAGLAS